MGEVPLYSLFTSGKLVLTGAKSWCQCLLASLHIAKLLMQFCDGVVFKAVSTSIQNIVGNAVIPLHSNQYLNLQIYVRCSRFRLRMAAKHVPRPCFPCG